MPRPYIQLGAVKIAPFKDPRIEPYGPFANATAAWVYPIKQSLTIHEERLHFHWPSAEHAFHAQKLLHLKEKLPAADERQAVLTKTLHQLEHTKSHPKDEFLPHSDYNTLINGLIESNPSLYFGNNNKEFEALCDANYHGTDAPHQGLMANGKPYILEFMRRTLKMKFEQNPKLKQLAIDCAREEIMPIDVNHLDNYWASGPEGQGQNQLGIMILELGNGYLSELEQPS